jgi:hypothetical protein
MNIRNTFLSGFAALALAAGANAQEIDTLSGSGGPGFNQGYSDDQLILGFFSASDASNSSGINSQGDLLFNLGNASSFTGLAAGTYSVAAFNGSATAGQPALGSGTSDLTSNLTVPSNNTFWTVMGSDETSEQLWLTGAATQTRLSVSGQTTIANDIALIGSAANAPLADGSAFDSSQGTGNQLLSTGRWNGSLVTADAVVPTGSNSLALYSLLPGTGSGGSSTKLGTFTLTDTAGVFSLSFTVTAIPEPSTYAAILGALTVGFVLIRRRMGSATFNTLA